MAKKAKRRVIPFYELSPDQIAASLREGTDLACVLIGAAYIENATGFLLEMSMIDHPLANGPNGLLNNPTGILSTASARADISFCLALIDEFTHKNIKTIAKIRNCFAHSHTSVDFANEEIKRLCGELEVQLADATSEKFKLLEQDKAERIVSVSRYKFVLAVLHAFITITCATLNTQTDDKGEFSVQRRKRPVFRGGRFFLKTDGKSFPDANVFFFDE